jgi:hypothetical protein
VITPLHEARIDYCVCLDGQRVFSKKSAGRFPKPGEVAGLFEKTLGPALEWRGRST